jgi:hypothetical protein
MSESCNICKFWKKEKEGDMGECRRYPPFLRKMAWHVVAESDYAIWPKTYMHQWCGEYKEK